MPRVTENLSFRLPSGKLQKLDEIATSLDRSRNWLLNTMVEEYLEVYEWQAQQIRERLELDLSGQAEYIDHEAVMVEIEAMLDMPRQ